MAITSASTAALALLDGADHPLPVHSVYPSGVNLRCGDYLVQASSRGHGGVASLGVTPDDVKVLGRCRTWEWRGDALVADDDSAMVSLVGSVEPYQTCPPSAVELSAAAAGRLEHARRATRATSWFDVDPGRSLGLPRVRAALAAMVRCEPDAAERVHGIIGLGIGLTPSADDALVGALCLLEAAAAVPPGLVADLRGWLRGAGVTSTTEVSLSYLRLAVEGAFSASVNGVVACLAEDSTPAALQDAVLALSDLGATSGMDTAVGLQLVCELLTWSPPGPDPS